MTQANSLTQSQIAVRPRSWLARKWKLLLGLLVGLMLLGVAGIFGIFTLIMSSIKGSDVAKESMARAQTNPAVVQHLGTPIEMGWFVSGSINVSVATGDADLAIPISGPKGKGTVYVTAQKSGGAWTYSVMNVAFEGSGERINLLGDSSVAQADPSPATPAMNPAPVSTPESSPATPASDPAASAVPPDPSSIDGIGTGDGEQTGTKVVITELKKGGSTVTLKFTIYNNSNADLNTGGRFKADGYKDNGGRSFSGLHLIDSVSKKKYFVVADSDGNCLCSEHVDDIKPKTQISLWAKFPAPPDNIQKITVEIPHFIPIDDVPIR